MIAVLVEFSALLLALEHGFCRPETWEFGAVTHYASPNIESARIRLVQKAIESDQGCWPVVSIELQAEAVAIQELLSRTQL